jgi:hypothetical protein
MSLREHETVYRQAPDGAELVIPTNINRERGAKTGLIHRYRFVDGEWCEIDEDGEVSDFDVDGFEGQSFLHALWYAREEIKTLTIKSMKKGTP